MKILPIRLLIDVAKRTLKEMGADDVGVLAAALTYYAIFSLVPLIILMVTIASFVLDPEKAQETVLRQVSGFAPGETAKVVADIVKGALENRSNAGATILATVIGVGGLLLSSSGVFGTLDKALNRAWGCEYKESFLKDKLVSFAMVLGVAVVLGASLVLSAVLTFVQTSSKGAEGIVGNLGWLWQIVGILVSILLSTGILLIIFRVLPRCEVRVREVWFGALLTAIGWEVLKIAFAFYLGNFANSASVYGTFGALFSLITWIYLTGFIMLIGAEFTSEYANALRKIENVKDVTPEGVVPATGPGPAARAWRSSHLSDKSNRP